MPSFASNAVPDTLSWSTPKVVTPVWHDRAALIYIHDLCAPRVQRYARHPGMPGAMAHMTLREVLLECLRKASRFDPIRASFGPWLGWAAHATAATRRLAVPPRHVPARGGRQ